ncbi:MAG: transporter substrate-binding domain-containing protein [Actinomycetota bacterium]|nr:transporter substrate-binding domain-containing protein [Actinomycetota bacterium]
MPPRVSSLCVLVILLTACVPPEPVLDLSRPYDEETVMGEIQARGHLVIAVADDAYPLGYVDQNDEAQGFTAELGRYLADTLGVEARFITGSSTQLLELPEEERADVAFPAVPITEASVRKHQFTDPYYVSHQRLLTPFDGAQTVEELSGKVCSFADEETQVSLDELNEDLDITAADPLTCLSMLKKRRVVAATGSDFLLAGLRLSSPQRFQVVGDQLTTEGIGAVIERGAAAWTDYVNGVFFLAEQEGVWQDAFDDSIGLGLGVQVDPPVITAEEAAALYPSDL